MGLLGSLTGGILGSTKGQKAAGEAMRNSYWTPQNLNFLGTGVNYTPGYTPTKKEWKAGQRPTPGNFTVTPSEELQGLYGGLMGLAGQSIGNRTGYFDNTGQLEAGSPQKATIDGSGSGRYAGNGRSKADLTPQEIETLRALYPRSGEVSAFGSPGGGQGGPQGGYLGQFGLPSELVGEFDLSNTLMAGLGNPVQNQTLAQQQSLASLLGGVTNQYASMGPTQLRNPATGIDIGAGTASASGNVRDMGQFSAGNLPTNMQQQLQNGSQFFLNRAMQDPNFNFDQVMQDRYNLLKGMDAPADARSWMNNYDSQLARGILSSTAGQYQTAALGETMNNKDMQNRYAAFDQALALGNQYDARQAQNAAQGLGYSQEAWNQGQGLFEDQLAQSQFLSSLDQARINRDLTMRGQNTQASIASAGNAAQLALGKAGLDLQSQIAQDQMFGNRLDRILASGAGEMGALGQYGEMTALNNGTMGSRVADRFNRANQMFGTGLGVYGTEQEANLAYLNQALSGVGDINSFLASLAATSGNLGSARSNANSNAYAPVVNAAMQADNTASGFLKGALGSFDWGGGFRSYGY